ncbi:hypothetical protein NU688_15210 [Variovorax sp. ZS18.2.2]|nr:hypothetical protein [Variovorax sp. ZS18.2.2]
MTASLSSRHACRPWIDESFSARHSFAGKATIKSRSDFSLRLFAFWVLYGATYLPPERTRRSRAGFRREAGLRLSLGLGHIDLPFGMELMLAAVIAAIEAQPWQDPHPSAAARALEMIDAAWTGRKQVVHKEGDLDVMGPLTKLYGLSADVLQCSILPAIRDHRTTMFAVFVIFATTCRLSLGRRGLEVRSGFKSAPRAGCAVLD